MAILACRSSCNKEKVPPPHGVAVKSHRMKRAGACGMKARNRVPLRDITNLFLPSAESASAAAQLRPREEPAPAPSPVAARSGAPDVVAVQGRRLSLRKEFR